MLIQTASLPNTAAGLKAALTPSQIHQLYCGMDSLILPEIHSATRPQLNSNQSRYYNFSRALQAPYLSIMRRGFPIDQLSRSEAVNELQSTISNLQYLLNLYATAIWDHPLNARSHSQLKDFFYDRLKIPPIYLSQKGERKLSLNREALEKIHEKYLYARPFITLILAIRDYSKQLEVFTTDIDSDGRFRSSYNIAGTETGRPSSSTSAFGTGGNAQNIAPRLRYVFVSDPGHKLCSIDAEQVEARDEGYFCGCLFGDWSLLDACESGDLHTTNAKRIWPELGWSGNPLQDREVAERRFYRDFSYRDMAKRGSHLTNYMGTAYTAARSLKVPQHIMEEFQARYCRGGYDRDGNPIQPAYPCITRYWQWCAETLQTTGTFTNPFGFTRRFFGRPDDDTTLREAIAGLPQSTTAQRTNLALWRVWKYLPEVQLLAQTYDSITFQYPETANENDIIGRALELLVVPLQSNCGREYIVPWEAKVGWNWGNKVTQSDIDRAVAAGKTPPRLNLGGLAKFKPQ